MIPTLSGRIQTRIWLILFIGIPWTLIITPFLPNNRDLIEAVSYTHLTLPTNREV